MPTYRNDDDIHRYQAEWVEMGGWPIAKYIRARWTVWAVFAAAALIVGALITFRFVGGIAGAFYAAVVGGFIAYAAAPFISNEVGLIAWAQTFRSEIRAHRTAKHRDRHHPTRYATERIHAAKEQS